MRTQFFKRPITIVLSFLIGIFQSCSHQDEGLLQVGHYHLQSIDTVDKDSEMARGEQLYRLRGAVTIEERTNRLGHYYSVDWKRGPEMGRARGMKVVMDYQQASTASKVLRMSRDIPDGEESGKMEFRITGESYRTGGRVLAWRIRLLHGGRVLAKKQSYLWK